MPWYVYKCPQCGQTDEVVKPMNASNTAETCTRCHAVVMERDYQAEVATSNSDTHSEIHSDSLAIHPSQAQEHRERFPDVPLDGACRPVFTSVKQRSRYLDQRGVVKIPHLREF